MHSKNCGIYDLYALPKLRGLFERKSTTVFGREGGGEGRVGWGGAKKKEHGRRTNRKECRSGHGEGSGWVGGGGGVEVAMMVGGRVMVWVQDDGYVARVSGEVG